MKLKFSFSRNVVISIFIGNSLLKPCNVVSTVKHGDGNILLLGAFTWDDIMPLKGIQETMDSQKYQNLMTSSLLSYYEENRHNGLIYQLDNDPNIVQDLLNSFLYLIELMF